MSEVKKVREFMLSENVSESNIGVLIKEIRDINKHDDEQEKEKKEYEREPITLIINTFGGSAYDCLGLIATMQMSKTPIHTVCVGKAMSAGFWLMSAGHKRFAHSLSTFMYHTMRAGTFGDIQSITEDVEEYERLGKVLDGLILKNTNITEEKLSEIRKLKKDWFMSGEEAKKYGVVDELL